jgi:uncharacterized 2Fe-2S/4Fe-4S cluster protein (DUF4445 family)
MPALTLTQKKRLLEFESGDFVLDILNSAEIKVSSACAGHGFCGLCRIKILKGEVSNLTSVEKNCLSIQQIQQGTRLACQVQALSDITVTVENPINVLKWKKLHPLDKTAVNNQDQYGIALDLGTTHLRLSLWNITQHRRVLAWSAFNPQFRFGADVLTRLMAAQNSEVDALELSLLIKQAIKNALMLIAKLPLEKAQIKTLLVVGNTPMLALLSHKNFQLLLEPDYWTQAIDCQIEDIEDWQKSLGLTPQTMIATVPALAGFIGSDLLAGILATGLTRSAEAALLIDFGTNSELALWDGEKLWLSSVPGGPAFEGSGISCGLPAGTGAVYRMMEKPDNFWDYEMFGKANPLGLCGSALVDVIAQLLRTGQLTRNGRFKNPAITEVLLPLTQEKTLTLKKQDIDIFQRAKAATGAAQQQLFQQAGIGVADLRCVYVCGAFGQFLDVKNAQTIGLLPQIAVEKVILSENTALSGCELLLSEQRSAEVLKTIRTQMQIVNMAYVTNFDESFVNNLYLQPLVFEK